METVLKLRGWSGREWARRAELAEESHVTTLMRRMREQPDRLAGDVETYTKLAAAAGVSLDWLLLGRGVPGAPAAIVPDDARYPTRPGVLVMAHWLGIPKPVIEAVANHEGPERDPGVFYWLALLNLKHSEVGQTLALPPKPGE